MNERRERQPFMATSPIPPKLSSDCYTRIRFVETEKKGDAGLEFRQGSVHALQGAGLRLGLSGGGSDQIEERPGAVQLRSLHRLPLLHMPPVPSIFPNTSGNPPRPGCRNAPSAPNASRTASCRPASKPAPPAALHFDDYDKVVAEAKRRLAGDANSYVNHIYGLKEVGGTSWMYISGVPFEELGFKTDLPEVALPTFTWSVLSSIPAKVGGIVALLSAVAYFRSRGANEEGKR